MNPEIVAHLKTLQKHWMRWDSASREYVEIMISPTVIERDGKVIVSAEDGLEWANYYGEMDEGPYPWIHKTLEDFAEDYDMHWEWENPGCISLWRN